MELCDKEELGSMFESVSEEGEFDGFVTSGAYRQMLGENIKEDKPSLSTQVKKDMTVLDEEIRFKTPTPKKKNEEFFRDYIKPKPKRLLKAYYMNQTNSTKKRKIKQAKSELIHKRSAS